MQTHWKARDYVAALALFFATAAIVLWQNARVAILWDLSYILDSAYRIAIGQVPYRDLPFAHAPLTFLIQAAIIRLAGRVYFHHVLYAAIVGGLATVLTWRIAIRTLANTSHSWLTSTLLTIPLTVLGVYSILPIPFYDCDCTISILAAIYLLQRLKADSTPTQALTAGATLILPVFFKQNIGLPFLLTALAGLSILIAIRTTTKPGAPRIDSDTWVPTRTLIYTLAGTLSALALALALLQLTVGLKNYLHWTVTFAAQRRMPGIHDMLAVYAEPSLRWTLPATAIAVVLLFLAQKARHLDRSEAKWRDPVSLFAWTATLLLALPFLQTLYTLTQTTDPDDRAASLLALWPLLLILAAIQAMLSLRKGPTLQTLLPILMLAAIHGTLLSQQLWGSTYALWPLLILLIAGMLSSFSPSQKICHPERSEGSAFFICTTPTLAAIIALTLTTAGYLYAASEERLSYSSVLEGPIQRSTLPELKGLSAHGPFLPAFDELIRFTEQHIPKQEGILLLNGEDPFFFVTGRTPQFPILLFDPATDPYTPQQVIDQVRTHQLHWLILKRNLQIKEDPTPHREQTIKLLKQEFKPYAQLENYDLYHRQ